MLDGRCRTKHMHRNELPQTERIIIIIRVDERMDQRTAGDIPSIISMGGEDGLCR